MKNLTQHIQEKLRISNNTIQKEHTLFPKNRSELIKMIEQEIKKNGNECSLNHIDVSEITDLSKLFFSSNFIGDISKWNVSNVTDMESMFRDSKFNGDISDWNINNNCKLLNIFTDCPLEKNPPKWYKK